MEIGLIGCGQQAPKHISGLCAQDAIDVILADLDVTQAEALAAEKGLLCVGSVDDFFESSSITAIDIVTPTSTHAPLIRQALSSNKHFFCEKPLCETVSEANELARLTEQAGRIGMIGYIYRFAAVFEEIKKICGTIPETGMSDVLGRPVTAMFRIGGRGSKKAWKHTLETGGGAINEMLVHMLDLAIWFFGPVAEAELIRKDLLRPQRYIQGEIEDVDAEDFVIARFKTVTGFVYYVQADLVTPGFSQMVEIQGENASVMGSIVGNMPAFVNCIKAAGGYDAGTTQIESSTSNLFLKQMEHFVTCVRENTQPTICTLQDSVMVMEAVEMLRASSRIEL